MRTEHQKALRRAQKERNRRRKGMKPRKLLTEEERKLSKKEAKKLYKEKFPEKVAAERRRYYNKIKDRPEFKIAKNLRKRFKECLKRTTKLGEIVTLIGCTVPELKLHLEQQFTEGMTWDNYGKWHIDHIKPICAFDLSCPNERLKVNHYTNLRPLWGDENSTKAVTDKLLKFKKVSDG